jgi:uncharacterized protein (DUF2141 family)
MKTVMQKFFLAYMLISLGVSWTSAQVPTIRLTGQVFQTSGPVPNHDIRIRFFSNDPADTTVVTDSNGVYVFEKELINNSQQGTFNFTLEDCDKTVITKNRNWGAFQGYDLREDFEICVDTSDDCSVRIVVLPNPSGGFNLVAVGQDIERYQWSTGDSTRTIQVRRSDIYCVTVTDVNGCRATDCVDVNTSDVQNCGVNILLRFSPDPSIVRLQATAKGSGNFRFKWDTGDTTRTIQVTQPGRYCVYLTDEGTGCMDSACFDVRQIHFGQGQDCAVWFSTINLGGTQFLLRALNNRPQDQVKYLWSTGDTTQTIQVMNAGIYCVTATFSDGCRDVFCGPVLGINPTPCSVDIETELKDPIGIWKVTAIPSGGNFVSINWSNGAQTESTEVLGPATVCLSVVYDSGCRAKKCIRLPEGSINFREGSGFSAKSEAQVFPNPFNQELQVQLQNLENQGGTLNLTLMDMQGNVVLERQNAPVDSPVSLDTNELKPGMYVLRVLENGLPRYWKVLKE